MIAALGDVFTSRLLDFSCSSDPKLSCVFIILDSKLRSISPNSLSVTLSKFKIGSNDSYFGFLSKSDKSLTESIESSSLDSSSTPDNDLTGTTFDEVDVFDLGSN